MSNVLVIAEHLHGKFPKTTLVALRGGQEPRDQERRHLHRGVLGQGVDALASELATYGMNVIAVDDARLRPLPRRRLRRGHSPRS